MGTISRLNSAWTNHVHINSWRSGPSGQMASLIHRELETVADSVGHLAWVQQKAQEAQLDAQYRIARLQASANAELRELNARQQTQNNLLFHVTTQLDSIAAVLQAIDRGQSEQLQIVKAERTLKEVLFQPQKMLEEMIIPGDEIARLALCQIALDELDHHGLGTSHLSDLADKRVFAEFVKSTRQQIRNATPEVQADLLAFETWYKGYNDAVSKGVPAFNESAPPQWRATKAPVRYSRPQPPRPIRPDLPSPTHRSHPGEFPSPSDYAPLPMTEVNILKDYHPQMLFSPSRIPTKAETDSRFPHKPTSVFGWIDSKVNATEYANARRYEQALRDWAEAVQAHESYVSAHQQWLECNDRLSTAYTRMSDEVYPRAREVWEAKERVRREAFEKEWAEFVDSETQRHEKWQNDLQSYEEREARRRSKWHDELKMFQDSLRKQATLLNDFLESHVDLQGMCRKLNVERDIQTCMAQVHLPADSGRKAHKKCDPPAFVAEHVEQGCGITDRGKWSPAYGMYVVECGPGGENKVWNEVKKAVGWGRESREWPAALPMLLTAEQAVEMDRRFAEAGIFAYPFAYR